MMTQIKLLVTLLCLLMKTLCYPTSYDFKYVTRDEWNASRPKNEIKLIKPVHNVVIHHTFTPPSCNDSQSCKTAMKTLQETQMIVKSWVDIGVNFAIGGDGAVYEGRGWDIVGAHTLHFNVDTIGIFLIGDWRVNEPPEVQLNTTKKLLEHGVKEGHLHENYTLIGHNQASRSECPGQALYEKIKLWPHYNPNFKLTPKI